MRSRLPPGRRPSAPGAWRLAAEQALDPQHVVPRPLREPLPQQLRRRVDALRIGRVVFAVGLRRGPVEDEVGPVVDQRGVDARRRLRQRPDAEPR